MMKYKAIALDLDGTLTDSNKQISDINKKAVQAAAEKGVYVILASGRPTLGVVPIAEKLGLDKLGGYILSYNGGRIMDCRTKEIIRKVTIPMQYYQTIYDAVKKFNVELITYDDEGILSENPEDFYVQKEVFCNSCGIKKLDCLLDAVKEPVCKFLAVADPAKIAKLMEYMNANYSDIVSCYCSEPYFLEIIAKGIEKASGLDTLGQLIGYKQNELIACGDGLNDLTMLKYAGLGVVMENASCEVKKYADFIAPSNDNNGVAFVINKFLLNAR